MAGRRASTVAAIFLGIAIAQGRSLSAGAPALDQTELFAAGHGGYHTYRIPALVVTKNGTVLAFCEGRKNNASDHGHIDLMLRRSTDGGRTWGKMQRIADDGHHTMGNPCPVVDLTSGTIWLPLCRNNQRVLLMKSTDDGKTWSRPRDITKQAMDPEWHWVGTGPGHGIQLKSGRLVVPCWADATGRLGQIQFSFVFYSDDNGKTWQNGAALERDASDECEVIQRADGSLYMNMRSRRSKKQRAYSTSTDGGKTWASVRFDARLPEPSCQGSIIRLTGTPQFRKNRILLSCPANPAARDHLTVRISYDGCRSWAASKVLCSGPAAYCDLAVTRDRQILCAYEADNYAKIALARFNLEWLTNGKDTLGHR